VNAIHLRTFRFFVTVKFYARKLKIVLRYYKIHLVQKSTTVWDNYCVCALVSYGIIDDLYRL